MPSDATDNRLERVGLFGGTFDPVHFGHLRPAIEMLEHFKLDRLNLLPNHRPAHRGNPGASTRHRVEMLELATQNNARLKVDAREASRDKPSYTFDTLTEYRELYPSASLLFFMGVDAFAGFESWFRWQDILMLANIIVVNRPDANLNAWAESLIEQQSAQYGSRAIDAKHGVVERIDVTQLAISATAIREASASGRSIDYLLPQRVQHYIEQNGLYGALK